MVHKIGCCEHSPCIMQCNLQYASCSKVETLADGTLTPYRLQEWRITLDTESHYVMHL